MTAKDAKEIAKFINNLSDEYLQVSIDRDGGVVILDDKKNKKFALVEVEKGQRVLIGE